MGIITLVTCQQDNYIKPEKSLFNYLFSKLCRCFFEQRKAYSIKKIDIYENVSMLAMTIPYSYTELKVLRRSRHTRIYKMCRSICQSNDADELLLSSELQGLMINSEDASTKYSGKFLYRSLVLNIIEHICRLKGTLTGDFDITIIQGESLCEFYDMIWLLSAEVKYLTVVAKDTEMIQSEITKIYEETGLSVSILQDMKGKTSRKSLIINLGKLNKQILGSSRSDQAIIIDYGSYDDTGVLTENIVIRGINAELPFGIALKLGRNLLDSFNSNILAEATLIYKLNYLNLVSQDILSENCEQILKAYKDLSLEFKINEYSISAIIGRYGELEKFLRRNLENIE